MSENDRIHIKSPEAREPSSEIKTCQNKIASFIDLRKASQIIKNAFMIIRKLERKRG